MTTHQAGGRSDTADIESSTPIPEEEHIVEIATGSINGMRLLRGFGMRHRFQSRARFVFSIGLCNDEPASY